MNDATLLLPLAILLAGGLLAALFSRPRLNGLLSFTQLCWIVALAPLAAFILLVLRVPTANDGVVFTWEWQWLPSLGLSLGLYVDDLSLLFGLLVTFIGALIVVYTGQYYKGDQSAWRFLAYLMLFMVSMLGIVMAGDVLTLFIFWEGTSILSYLLVAYKTESEAARYGAFRALVITGGGGIALLGGLLFAAQVAGGTDFATLLTSGDALRGSEYYNVILALVAFGAFTKSAQFPAHIWLPGAMSAPTPASAYLHSATMVKAGIYLLARMNPALGFTETWFWLLTLVGGVTMIVGAYLGLKQNDQKALLAYSTISQLGILVILIGQDIPEAYKALVVGIVAHALYKSALFMMAGIVDHETGTRDLRRLGGLAKVMPFTFAVGALAALSMAGLPPMFGFLAKETLLATAVHPSMPPVLAEFFRWGAVLGGALMLAQAGVLIYETFLGKPKDPAVHGHEAPLPMWLAPAIPAALSIILVILPGPKEEAALLSGAAAAAFGGKVKVSTVLFHGLTVELALSIVAISTGTVLFLYRDRVRAWQQGLLPNLTANALYVGLLAGIDRAAHAATRLQQGKLRPYLMIILAGVAALVLGLTLTQNQAGLDSLNWSLLLQPRGGLTLLRLLAAFIVIGASAATVVLRRDFAAIMALGAAGLGMALIFVLEPAPDVALVQIVVDILALVIMVLALSRLPRSRRRMAQAISEDRNGRDPSKLWSLLLAAVLGLIVSGVTLFALLDQPNDSVVSPYYAENAKEATGATDIVGAIVVDFRALDTLIEITVFSLAGLGIYTLLYYAARKHGDKNPLEPHERRSFSTMGIGGRPVSPFVRATSYVVLPLSMMLAATHMMYGHDQPGDGFTAGVIISLAIALWYIVYGYAETRSRLPWLRPTIFVGAGILLAILTGTIAAFLTGSFLGNVDFTAAWAFMPKGFHISTSFLLEVSICLAVLGGATHMLNALGHPGEVEA
jgi:NADH:ubiquinone oxidoreductase subunit 5 (subunit L)/multisubunit Na+/H+ antiporter MnhA subunit/multisubunit Na+/H+ antiporter MnhB subunit